jgi:hypothetical protein
LFIPIAGLAALGCEALSAGSSRRMRNLILATFLLSAPTLLFIQLASIFSIQSHSSTVFLTTGEAQALAWIEEQTPARALVLSAPETGLLIPAYTGRRVLYGHPFETVDAVNEKAAVSRFFEDPRMSDTDYRSFLSQRGVDFIFYGPRERTLGDPLILQELSPVYNSNGVILYAAR